MFILFASAFINTFTTTIPKMDYDAPSNEVGLHKNDEYIEHVPSEYDYTYTNNSFNVDTYSYGSENYYVMTIVSAIPGVIDSVNTSIRYLNYQLDSLHHYMAELSLYM